jgi:uncharacterized protein
MMQLSKYIKTYPYEEDQEYLLFHSTKRSSKILLHKSILKSIAHGNLSTSDMETLTDLGFLVHDAEAEKKELVELIKDADKKRHFNAIVVLNLDCNLACKYCFEGKMKGKYYMSLETAELLIDFADRYFAAGKNVNIDFYGGEPLLSFEQIKYISKRLRLSADDKGLKYTFGLITNGTLLTKERVEALLPYGLKDAKVTIDGQKENHDIYRPFKTGFGTFDIIVRNIGEVCEIMDMIIGGNYTQENYKGFPLLLDQLIERGITPDKVSIVKFDPVTKVVENFALPDFRDGSESVNEPWIIDSSIYLREEILKRGFDTYNFRPSPCAIEFKDDIIVSHDGTLYKCPAFIGLDGFEVGDLVTGIKEYRESHNLDVWKNDECLDCEYLPLCFGGCRFMKLLRDGEIDDVDCKKKYFDAALEKFIKQDIKYQLNNEKH